MSVGSAPGAVRRREVSWLDPAPTLREAAGLTGLEYLRAVVSGALPGAPIGALMNIVGGTVDEGRVSFRWTPDESMLNPLGIVHGGVLCTLLDSVCGCAVHTLLPVGQGYTSIDIAVSFLRSPAPGGVLVAEGRVVKPGRRVSFAEATVHDEDGRLVATATSSLLVLGG